MDIISLTEKYGIAGLALIAPIPLYKYFWNRKKDIDSIPEIKKSVENVHDNCKFPNDTISIIQGDIEELKRENVKFDTQLINYVKTVERMDEKLDRLISFHMDK